MGGSGGGSWSPPRSNVFTLKDIEAKKNEAAYNAEVSSIINDTLKNYNERDIEAIKTHIDVLEKALSKEIEGFVAMVFGGSVAKHSYVDGLSDIDLLVNVGETEFSNKNPEYLLNHFANLIRERLPNTDVSTGKMAITIKYSDSSELQLLPAIKTETGLRVARANGEEWSNVVRPQRFAKKLTKINNQCSGNVIPVIKLFKGAQSSFPKKLCLSGYHVESLAVNAFRDYKGGLNKKEMFRHLCEYVANNVIKPVADSTGQSTHVDDKLGKENSLERRKISATVTRLVSRLDAADAKHSANIWEEILDGE